MVNGHFLHCLQSLSLHLLDFGQTYLRNKIIELCSTNEVARVPNYISNYQKDLADNVVLSVSKDKRRRITGAAGVENPTRLKKCLNTTLNFK